MIPAIRAYLIEQLKLTPEEADDALVVGAEEANEGKQTLRLYDFDVDTKRDPQPLFDLEELEVHDFKALAGKNTLRLKPGVTLLLGSNDKGKTALQQAFAWTLGGDKAVPGSEMGLVHLGKASTSSTARFVGQTAVTRMLNILQPPDGSKPTAHIAYGARSNGADYSSSTTPTAAAFLKENVLGNLTWDFWSRTAFAEQGQVQNLLREQPAKRKELFAELLGMKVAGKTQEFLTKRAAQLDTNAVALEQKARMVEEDITGAETAARDWTAEKEAERTRLQGEVDTARGFDATESEEKLCIDQLDRAKKLIEEGEKQKVRADELRQLIPADLPNEATITEWRNKVNGIRTEYQTTRDRVTTETAKLAQMAEGGKAWKAATTCGACGQGISDAIKTAKLAELRSAYPAQKKLVDELTAAMAKMEEEGRTTADKIVKASQAAGESAGHRAELKLLQRPDGPIDSDRKAVADMEERLKGVRLKLAGKPSLSNYEEKKSRLALLTDEAGRAKAAQTNAEEWRAKVVDLKVEACDARAKQKQLLALAKAFHKDGAPRLEAQKHREAIEQLMNERLAQFGTRVKIDDSIGVEVTEGDKKIELVYDSGSSLERIGLMFRAAATYRLGQVTGRISSLLWVDEVAWQDPTNAKKTAAMIVALKPLFPKILLADSSGLYRGAGFDNEIILGPPAVVYEHDKPLFAKLSTEQLEAVKREVETATGAAVEWHPAGQKPEEPVGPFGGKVVNGYDMNSPLGPPIPQADLDAALGRKSFPCPLPTCEYVHTKDPVEEHKTRKKAPAGYQAEPSTGAYIKCLYKKGDKVRYKHNGVLGEVYSVDAPSKTVDLFIPDINGKHKGIRNADIEPVGEPLSIAAFEVPKPNEATGAVKFTSHEPGKKGVIAVVRVKDLPAPVKLGLEVTHQASGKIGVVSAVGAEEIKIHFPDADPTDIVPDPSKSVQFSYAPQGKPFVHGDGAVTSSKAETEEFIPAGATTMDSPSTHKDEGLEPWDV